MVPRKKRPPKPRPARSALPALLLLLALLTAPAIAQEEYIVIGTFEDVPAGEDATIFPSAGSAILYEEDGWPRTITVTVGGDCTIGCTDSQRGRKDGFARVVAEKGNAWPFSGVLEILQNDDLTLMNFEGTLTDSTEKADKLFNFKGPAEYTEILTLGSVEAVNLANNHFHDYGEEGKQDTLDALDAAGIVYSVQGQPGIYETRGVRIGLIGNTFPYSSGQRDIAADVQALREAGCQIVIASFHWGSEYEEDYTRDQRNIGRAAIDAGADVVIGHHPHVIQGIERYNDRYILYSLGNFVFGGNTNPDRVSRDTYLAQLRFEVYEDHSVAPKLTIIPARVTALSTGTDYRPVLAQGDTAQRIIDRILQRSANMGDFKGSE